MISQNNMKNTTNSYGFSKEYLKEYINYSNYLVGLDLAPETIDWRLKHIRGFLKKLEEDNIKFSKLQAIHVYDYMNSIYSLSPKTKENRAICIRLFLNFLYQEKKIKIDGNKVLDKIHCPKGSTVVSTYTNEELRRIMDEVDTSTNFGKRDYAILLLFIHYGLRLKDVQYLALKNINWLDNKIIIVQHKDNEINEFPLTREIRYALLDYLKNARNESKSENIFLSKNGTLLSSGAIYNIANKYFKKANISTIHKHSGPHAFRHSLATSLLEEKNGIRVISSILGHDNLETTKVYAKVQMNELKKMSLEVPTWKI